MALFENKKKPVDIYADGTATVEAQNKTSDIAKAARDKVAGVAKVALSGVTAPATTALGMANDIAENTIVPAAQAIARPIIAGRENQVRTLANRDLNANRTLPGDRAAMAMTLGPNFERKVGGVGTNQPIAPIDNSLHGKTTNIGTPESGVAMAATIPNVQQPLARGLQRDGIQSQRIAAATGDSFVRAMDSTARQLNLKNDIDSTAQQLNNQKMTTEYGQGPNGTFTKRLVPVANPEMAEARRNLGTQNKFNVGNMEVTFDGSVDPAARKAFLTDPVRPTAQINRFNSRVGNDADQGALAAQNATRMLGPNNNREVAKVGWQERKAYNLQDMQNKQMAENARLSSDTQLAQARMSEGTAAERNAIDRTKVANDFTTSREQNAINRENITGMNAERGVNVADKQFDIGMKQKREALVSKYNDPKTTEEERARIAPQIGVKSGFEKIRKYDENGMVISEDLYNTATGEPKVDNAKPKLIFDAQDPATISHLQNLMKTNPKEYERLKAEWKARKNG